MNYISTWPRLHSLLRGYNVKFISGIIRFTSWIDSEKVAFSLCFSTLSQHICSTYLQGNEFVSYLWLKILDIIAKTKPICTSCLSSIARPCNQYSQQSRFDKVEKWNVRLDSIKRNNFRRFYVRSSRFEPTTRGPERNCNSWNSCQSVTCGIIKRIRWRRWKYCTFGWRNVTG